MNPVVPYFQGTKTGPGPFPLLELIEILGCVGADGSQLIEIGIESWRDDAAVLYEDWRFLGDC